MTSRALTLHADILNALGGRQVFGSRTRQIDLLEEVERGLPTKAYSAIARVVGLTPEEEDRLLRISLRTRRRWKQRARLDPATSDRLVRLARILALATEVLENQEHAVAWRVYARDSDPARAYVEASRRLGLVFRVGRNSNRIAGFLN